MPAPHHVVLVDDETAMRALLARLIRQIDPLATIAEAADGAAALLAIHAHAPDLVITDYQMPQMNGLALVGALRAQGYAVPIVVVSADGQLAESFLAAGASVVLRKPLQLAAFRELVRALLHGGREAALGSA